MSVGNLENALQLAFDRAQIQQKSADWVGKNPFYTLARKRLSGRMHCTAAGRMVFRPASGGFALSSAGGTLGCWL